ncbi:hypothetical protein JRO89_XS11G0226600 [Xanthoceras sorbifolium]|uniref:LRR receptor-like serine/threonine-protein kinase n=1 Tax=Xanthoceras sorbifolium TaxID=99658 RepID=A0ABQ8HGU5_9ROSI|nr:hypothetical protein JRO89_XS11G0226600 [Xanthoceras sorbifolium]
MRRIMLRSPPPPSPFLVVAAAFAFFWVCIFGLVHVSQAQTNQTQPTTDPDEARALNSMFQQWEISADQQQWNISGELCSGVATDSSNFDDQKAINPLIKCVCTYNNNTLCHITRLAVGINALSGELPKELGKMIDIRSFSIGSNNFSGPLPSELGNWTKLQQLHIDSSGVSGEIPSSLANLQDMKILWASDTELTGRIPDFIGNWSKLKTL